MKIRDLNLDDYVIVYDIGKSEHSEGMTVVGRVFDLLFNNDDGNVGIINSMGNLYEITDNNDFELWSKSIEGKTESVSKAGLRNLNVGDWIQYVENNGQERFGKVSSLTGLHADKIVDNDTRIELQLLNGKTDYIKQNSSEWIKVRPNEAHLLEKDYRERFVQSNDLQQRKRNKNKINIFQLKPGDHVKVKNSEFFRKGKVLATPKGKSELNLVSIRDDYDGKIFFIDNTFEVELIHRKDTVNHPSHYNYGEIEVIDFIEQVTKHYNPNVAYHIGNAIKYLARSPHKNGKEDVEKAKWYIERAYENWDK